MRKGLEFKSKGVSCHGWLYLPDDLKPGKIAPAVVMAHGFASVKKMGLADFAEVFVKAGLVTMVFDYRCWGQSQGEPRNQMFAHDMVEDYRNAISWLSLQPQVDPERIGVWGSSFSGGLVLYVAAYDKRVKAVVAQIPSALTPADRREKDPEGWDSGASLLMQDRIKRYQTQEVTYIPVIAKPGQPCALPFEDAYEWFTEHTVDVPEWENRISVESLEKVREFDPVTPMPLIAPAPLLMIAAEHDALLPVKALKSAFDLAGEPKRLEVLDMNHFEPYEGPWFDKTSQMAADWFKHHLG
jgi:dienelactone hydrolase